MVPASGCRNELGTTSRVPHLQMELLLTFPSVTYVPGEVVVTAGGKKGRR